MSGEFYHIINKIRKARAGVEKEKVVEEISFRTVRMLVGLWAFVKSYSEVTGSHRRLLSDQPKRYTLDKRYSVDNENQLKRLSLGTNK